MKPDADGRWAENLRWVRAFLLAHFAVRSFLTLPAPFAGLFGWLFGGEVASPVPLGYEAILWASVIVGCAGLHPRLAMAASRAAVVCILAQMIVPHTPTSFPLTANHLWLELFLFAVLSFLNERREPEGELLLSTLRWMTAILFFYTGVQKLLYGTYFDGQFLAFQISTEDRFADVFRFFVPEDEFRRLEGLSLQTQGSGPYRVNAPLFMVISNAVYVFEILIPILLLWRRSRLWATLAGIAFVILIELGAREFTFGVLMVNLFLVFLPGAWNKWLFPVSMVLYLPLIASHVGILDPDLFYYAPA